MVVLLLMTALGVGARGFNLAIPAKSPGGGGTIFDEAYYVNAARLIAGVALTPGDRYYGAAPAGTDPNGEHPQLAKMVIAAAIEVGGDNAVAWRVTAVVFSLAAVLALYWLVRCAGGGPWLAVGASALASFENLWVVSGRIAVLDIYCVPFLLAGVACYLRRRPIVAGLLLAVGACFKEVALFGVLVVLVLEAMRALRWLAAGRPTAPTRQRLLRPVALVAVTVVSFISALSILDAAVTPYSGGHPVDRGQAAICAHLWVWASGCNHMVFITNYADRLTSPNGPQGIASYPWQFWVDIRSIPYFTEKVTVTVTGHPPRTTTTIDFRGYINRVLLYTSWVAILASLGLAIVRRDTLSFLTVAWIVGTWGPIEALSLFEARTSYLYYMVITMPALYIAVSRLLAAVLSLPRRLFAPGATALAGRGRLLAGRATAGVLLSAWVALFLVEFVNLYPFRTFSGH